MSNPQSKVNLERFESFVKVRTQLGDWEDYVLANRIDLNKQMVARECEFDRKRITGNSKILALYNKVKEDLFAKGILTKDNRTPSQKHDSDIERRSRSVDKRSLKKAQESHAAVEEELYQVKKELDEAKRKLERYKAIEDYMLATGRL